MTPRSQQPFRFNVQCSSPPAVDRSSWRALARRCEALGYSCLTVSDHLDEQVAPATALMAAADATTELRIGSMVFCNDFRHPVSLAKEAATLDLLSEGRLELGLGAGWLRADYERAGIALDPPSVRVSRLEEAVRVIKGLLSEEPVFFSGRHYRVDGLRGTPRPLQRPYPPIFLGGGGRGMLELAAREADIVGLNPSMASGALDASIGPDATATATERKLAWIRGAAGSRFDELVLQSRVHIVVVTSDRMGVASQLASGFGLTPEQALESPHALCGTVEEIVDDLVSRRERFGISTIGVPLDALDSLGPVVAKLAGT